MSTKRPEKTAEDDLREKLGRAFAGAAELLAEQPRRMVENVREFGREYERISRKINHGIRRTNGRIR